MFLPRSKVRAPLPFSLSEVKLLARLVQVKSGASGTHYIFDIDMKMLAYDSQRKHRGARPIQRCNRLDI